jgi:hypothetical protein
MRSRITTATLAVAVMFLTWACSAADRQVWLEHNTHFASGEHAGFSFANNKDGSNPRVTRSDIDFAREQKWWGIYAVTVDPKQIMQN